MVGDRDPDGPGAPGGDTPGVPDALDYAITGDPLPDELADDPEFARSYQRATADVDMIRRGLAALAAQTPPATETSPATKGVPALTPVPGEGGRRRAGARPPRRWSGVVKPLLVAACLAGVIGVGGVVWSSLQPSVDYATESDNRATAGSAQDSSGSAAKSDGGGAGSGAEEPSGGEESAKKPAAPESQSGAAAGGGVDCAAVITVGEVAEVSEPRDGRQVVRIAVRWQVRPDDASFSRSESEGPIDVEADVAADDQWQVGRDLVLLSEDPGAADDLAELRVPLLVDPTAIWADTQRETFEAIIDRGSSSAREGCDR